jgi:hypothetical protein
MLGQRSKYGGHAFKKRSMLGQAVCVNQLILCTSALKNGAYWDTFDDFLRYFPYKTYNGK